jgi:hypothetical protein
MDRPIAVICALDWELAHLRGLLPEGAAEDWHDGHLAYVGRLEHQPMVLVGAQRAELLPGDVVVARHVLLRPDRPSGGGVHGGSRARLGGRSIHVVPSTRRLSNSLLLSRSR